MGNLFIENEHESIDPKRYYYCKLCKELYKRFIELGSSNRCSSIECVSDEDRKYNVFFNLSFNNIYIEPVYKCIEIHPSSDESFVILDLDPVISGGISRTVFCNYCNTNLGLICVHHPKHDRYERTFFLNKDKIL
tara:strand:- start:13 stop:417 length:405 start_codon:yes stop_codon:yes gene_type:complete